MGDLEFRILGPLEVVRGAGTVALPRRKERCVLAVLLLRRGEAVDQDSIIDALWPDAPPASATNLLQGYVSHLRKRIGREPIVTSPAGYALDVAPEQVDAGRFESLLEDARRSRRIAPGRSAALLREALALWRGPALAGLAQEPFADLEARRLDELRRVALEERIDSDLALGCHRDVIDELQNLLADDPLREANWGRLALALYRDGRQGDALDALRRARAHLREELGLDPGRELRRLEDAILAHDPNLEVTTAGAAEQGNLPSPAGRIVGRETELRALQDALAQHRLVTVTGPGGSGKTRLVVEGAGAAAPRFPDGTWFVDLATVRDDAVVAERLALVLGVRAGSARSIEDALVEHLRGRCTLILLDNCEHVIGGSAELAHRLVEGCGDITILATSREPLRAPGEALLNIVGLPVPAPGHTDVEQVTSTASARLFIERAQMARSGSVIDDGNAAAVARICRALDGLPLALELAAPHVRALSPEQIAEGLTDRLEMLDRGPRTVPPRHRSFRATLDWSYELLAEPEQVAFERLAVLSGSFSLAGAEAVVGSDAGGTPTSLLENLIDRSLVTRAPDGITGPRYRMLDTIRAYAAERLDERGGLDETLLHHAHFVAVSAEALEFPVRAAVPHRDTGRRLEMFEELRDDLTAALAWCFREEHAELAVRIVAAAWWGWWVRGPIEAGRVWAERALAAAGDRDDDQARALMLAAGWLGGAQSDHVASARLTWRLLDAAIRHGDDRDHGVALYVLARVSWARGRYREAEELLRESIDCLGSHPWFQTTAHAFLAQTLMDAGDRDTSAALAEVALKEARNIGEPLRIAFLLDVKASLALTRGDLGSAEGACREALDLYRRIGYQEGIVSALHTHARAALATGDHAAAAHALHEGLTVAHRLGHVSAFAMSLELLARLAGSQRRPGDAALSLGAARSVRDKIEVTLSPADAVEHEALLEQLRQSEGPDRVAEALRRGEDLTLDEAIDLAARLTAPAEDSAGRG